ncbi:elongation defective 1 protein [Actinidia rufa]|uniref:Elongation defective 1 protein n=1 Tax=Actinidia rufa TaxID=165716 RepID=A0A7J0FVA1_9ERIC|nr:elongation defective 1 protein [Actinidia rufa]
MAGLNSSFRPPAPSSHNSFASKLLLLLTVLPLTLAALAFILQWRGGGIDDPIARWSPEESRKFPGMDASPLATAGHSSSSDCSLFGHSSSPSFPYYRDWKFNFESDLKPKV